MKLIIDIDEDYYEILKFNVENGQKYKPWEIIANSTPYEEQSQGEWVIQPHSMIMKCSLCGNEENAKEVGIIDPDKHFCSFCGAKMKKENPDERIT